MLCGVTVLTWSQRISIGKNPKTITLVCIGRILPCDLKLHKYCGVSTNQRLCKWNNKTIWIASWSRRIPWLWLMCDKLYKTLRYSLDRRNIKTVCSGDLRSILRRSREASSILSCVLTLGPGSTGTYCPLVVSPTKHLTHLLSWLSWPINVFVSDGSIQIETITKRKESLMEQRNVWTKVNYYKQ